MAPPGAPLNRPVAFNPTGQAWREYHCNRLRLGTPPRQPNRARKRSMVLPKKLQPVSAEGNCYYCALSLELWGSESQHLYLRKVIVRFILDNDQAMRPVIGRPAGEYIVRSNMIEAGVWATEVEVYATAALLQTAIILWGDFRDENVQTCEEFRPPFVVPRVRAFGEEKIYLSLVTHHFQRVIG